MKTTLKVYVLGVIIAASSISLFAYDGSEAFLHYYAGRCPGRALAAFHH